MGGGPRVELTQPPAAFELGRRRQGGEKVLSRRLGLMLRAVLVGLLLFDLCWRGSC